MIDKGRRQALRTIGAAGLIGLAGCMGGDGSDGADGSDGSDGADGSDGSDGTDGGSSDAVSFWNLYVQGAPSDTAEDLISTFEEDTGINVDETKYENTPYKSAITNALGTSNAPDVFYVWAGPNRLGRYVQSGSVMPLDDYFSEDELSPFIPDAIRGVRYEPGDILSWRSESGSLFAMPHNLAGILLWYNKNVLKDAGIDPSTLQHSADTTWDEFLDVCQTVQDAGYTPIQCGNRNRWTIGHWMSAFMIKSVGVDGYLDAAFGVNDRTLDEDPIVEGVSRLATLYDEGYFNRDINSLNNNEAASLFFNDQAAFWHQGTWIQEQISSQAPDGFGGIPDHIDYMWWPAFPDLYENGANERVSVVPNSSFGVSSRVEQRGEEHLENTIEFLKYWHSEEAQRTWFEQTGQLVNRPSIYEEIDLDPTQETITSTLDYIDSADAVATVFDVAFLPETTEELLSGGQKLFTDGSAESLLQSAQSTNEDALSEFQ